MEGQPSSTCHPFSPRGEPCTCKIIRSLIPHFRTDIIIHAQRNRRRPAPSALFVRHSTPVGINLTIDRYGSPAIHDDEKNVQPPLPTYRSGRERQYAEALHTHNNDHASQLSVSHAGGLAAADQLHPGRSVSAAVVARPCAKRLSRFFSWPGCFGDDNGSEHARGCRVRHPFGARTASSPADA